MPKKNLIWMLIGCAVALLLIFLAPALELGNNVSLFLFVAAMFACHLFMPHGHGKHGNAHNGKSREYERRQH